MRRRFAVALFLGCLAVAATAPSLAAAMSTGDGSWVWQNPLPQGGRVNDVVALDALHAIAVGDHGLLLRTDDGGVTWERQPLAVVDNLNAAAFATPTTGVIVGDLGLVLRTTDGGVSWAASRPTGSPLNDVCFVNAAQGWAVGGDGLVLYTGDTGASWTPQAAPTTQTLSAVHFADLLHGWAVGRNGTILATSSSGTTWAQQTSGTTRDLHDVRARSATECWAVGVWTVLRTTDGGATWPAVTPPAGHTHVTYTAVDSAPSGAVTLAARENDANWGESGGVWTTTDAGATWQTVWDSTFAHLTCLAHDPAGTVAWAGGAGGLLIKVVSGTAAVTAGAPLPTLRCVTRAGDHLWALGSRTLLRFDGASWQAWPQPALSKFARSVTFFDAASGWVSDAARVWRTTDGGASWTQSAPLSFTPDDLDFASATVGVAVGYSGSAPAGGRILRTVDGGQTWVDVTPVSTPPALTAVDVVDATHAYAVGEGGAVLRTTDGSNWVALTSGVGDRLNDVCFLDASTGWIATSAGQVLATTDAGQHFAAHDAADLWLDGVFFSDPDHGWACGVHGTIVRYDRATGTWAPVDSGTDQDLLSVLFIDSLRGWAVGADGAVLATTTGGVPDLLPPVTTVSGVPAGWRNRDVVLTFGAEDPGGSGVVATRWRVDGAAWTEGTSCTVAAPADHGNDGSHIVEYFSADAFGNEEAPQNCTVSIDTRKPQPRAPYPVSVVRGRTATLRYRVNDAAPCAGTARPVVKVRTQGGRLLRTFKPAAKPVNTWLTLRFTCTLAQGKYRITVYATDAAGNRQARAASTTLTVR